MTWSQSRQRAHVFLKQHRTAVVVPSTRIPNRLPLRRARQLARTRASRSSRSSCWRSASGEHGAVHARQRGARCTRRPACTPDDRIVWITPRQHARRIRHDDVVPRLPRLSRRVRRVRRRRGITATSTSRSPARRSAGARARPDRKQQLLLAARRSMAMGRGFTRGRGAPGHPVASSAIECGRSSSRPIPASSVARISSTPRQSRSSASRRSDSTGRIIDERQRDIWVPMGIKPASRPSCRSTRRGTWWLVGDRPPQAPGVSVAQSTKTAVATVAARIALADSATHGGITGTASRRCAAAFGRAT